MSDAVMAPREAIEALAREYRPSMDKDTVHDWGADAASMLKRLAASPSVGGWDGARLMLVDLNAAPFTREFFDALNGYATGGSGRCLETLAVWNARLAPPPPPVSTGSRPQEAVPTAQAEAAVVVWRSPDEVPSVKAGEYAYRIVAVRRAHNGEVYSFGACYLNAVSLWFEDGNESREITGWNSEEGGDEPIYAPLLRDGDDLVGWCEYPIHSAATPQPADGRSSNEGAGK